MRDKTRDEICTSLQVIGIEARMAERHPHIGGGISLGAIDIPKGPIRWVDVRRSDDERGTIYYTNYGVPDSRLGTGFPKFKVKTVRKKNFPLFGKVVDIYWIGKDFGLGIIERLNSDIPTKQTLVTHHSKFAMSYEVKIRAHGDHRYWIIETETKKPPTEELWNCYQAIAKHLLAEWPAQSPKS